MGWAEAGFYGTVLGGCHFRLSLRYVPQPATTVYALETSWKLETGNDETTTLQNLITCHTTNYFNNLELYCTMRAPNLRLVALIAALYVPSLCAFNPMCNFDSHYRRLVARANLDDESLVFSRRTAFVVLSGAVGTLVAAQPAAAAGPTGGIASALGLGGGATPFGPVPKQGTTSPSGVTTYNYVVGPGPTPKYGQVLRIEWVRCLLPPN